MSVECTEICVPTKLDILQQHRKSELVGGLQAHTLLRMLRYCSQCAAVSMPRRWCQAACAGTKAAIWAPQGLVKTSSICMENNNTN